MSKIKLIVEKKNSSGVVIDRFPVNVIKAHIKNDGDRAVDSAEFVIPMSDEVNEGDIIKYIQDDVDTESLIALWNFHGSTRDESGYDNDGDDGTHTAELNEECPINKNYTDDLRYIIEIDGASQKITIPNKTHLTTGSPNVLDFSGEFDIFLRIDDLGYPHGSETLFSKRSATTGIEISSLSTNVSGGQDTSFIKVEVTSSSSTSTITGTTNLFLAGNEFGLIRVRRNSSGSIQLFFNGVEEGTSITNTTDLTTTGNAYFGADYTGSRAVDKTQFAMIRIYKSNLSDLDANTLLTHFRHPSTMKFHGNVWKIENQTYYKKILCKGVNRLLPETIINKKLLDSRSTASNGIDNVFKNLGASEILREILNEIDNEYIVTDDDNTPTSVGNFIAYGNLLSNLQLLVLVQNDQFVTLPRKVIIIDFDNDTKNYLFENGQGYKITSTGKDDSTVINDVGLKTNEISRTRIETPTASGNDYVLTKAVAAIHRVLDGSTVLNYSSTGSGSPSYTFDRFTNTVTLTSSPSGTVSIEYTYSDTSIYLANYINAASIAKYGRKSKNISPMGLQEIGSIGLFMGYYRDDNMEANQRVRIESPILINSLRVNQKIQVKNELIGINYTTGQSPDSIMIKSMEWFYPEGKTIINTGEHKFDSFDIDKFTAAQVRTLTEDADIVKTV